ncbi:MAG TPA: polysaccharide deacetylase family protein [Thermoanaerobaculia bacterium]
MTRLIVVVIALLAIAAGLFQLSRARTIQLFGNIVSRVETDRKLVALTFDDGPTREHAPEVLRVLREKHVKATFFLIGGDVAAAPDAARAIVAAGHEVGNHSYSHRRMVMKRYSWIRREIESTDALIRAAGHRGPILVRSPYCKKLLGVPWYLERHHRLQITWDVEPESDPEVASSAKSIAAHVVAKARPGSIILLHPMYAGNRESRAAIAPIIDGLRARGFELVTVSELLKIGK